MDTAQLQAAVAAIPRWWHSIDLGNGVITPGIKTPSIHQQDLASWHLPDMRGKTILDVGTWDGFYAFEAERRGAKRVVALDHYVWAVDWAKAMAYRQQCERQGIVRKEWPNVEGVWQPNTLPGKKGFDLARQVLSSRVEPIVADFMEADLRSLGTFDIVLFLGVLYHMRHPLLSLERLASATREVAVIETAATYFPARENLALCEFYETTELNGDPSNWWSPNRQALIAMCRAAGFRHVEIVDPAPFESAEVTRYRLCAHAWK